MFTLPDGVDGSEDANDDIGDVSPNEISVEHKMFSEIMPRHFQLELVFGNCDTNMP